jgi:hypothetical protein
MPVCGLVCRPARQPTAAGGPYTLRARGADGRHGGQEHQALLAPSLPVSRVSESMYRGLMSSCMDTFVISVRWWAEGPHSLAHRFGCVRVLPCSDMQCGGEVPAGGVGAPEALPPLPPEVRTACRAQPGDHRGRRPYDSPPPCSRCLARPELPGTSLSVWCVHVCLCVQEGELLKLMQDPTGRTPFVSEGHFHGPTGSLLLGSFRNRFLGRVTVPST